jgi:hypothetical protein
MILFSETMFFSILVSLFTQGLGAAANPGGILYPVRLWMETRFTAKLLKRKAAILEYREARRRTRYEPSNWMDGALMLLDLRLLYRALWHKPLLTCNVCMSSFWGIVIYLCFVQGGIHILLLGIPISSALTVLTHKLRP